jgi:hypothetical protein
VGECGEERVRLGCCSFSGEQGGFEKGHLNQGCVAFVFGGLYFLDGIGTVGESSCLVLSFTTLSGEPDGAHNWMGINVARILNCLTSDQMQQFRYPGRWYI